MARVERVTAIIQREGDVFVARCPEVSVVSQGDSLQEAEANLKEAVELFFEYASPTEVRERRQPETYVAKLDVKVG